MAPYQINLEDALLHGLFQQDGAVARLLEQVLNQVLQAQVAEQLQAAPYERTEDRQGYRNGTYPHTLTTRVGRCEYPVFVVGSSLRTFFYAISVANKRWCYP